MMKKVKLGDDVIICLSMDSIPVKPKLFADNNPIGVMSCDIGIGMTIRRTWPIAEVTKKEDGVLFECFNKEPVEILLTKEQAKGIIKGLKQQLKYLK